MSDFEQFAAFAHLLADASGRIILPYFESTVAVEAKADNSPVTQADREAEEAIRGLIAQHFPEHSIFGEEYGITLAQPDTGAASRYTWVIDPIDGTRAFIAGRKEWGTLIALCEDGIPILGLLNQPATGERWLGVAGQPTLYQGEPVQARACAGLELAELSTTSVPYFTPQQAAKAVALAQACRATVQDGDCYAYGLLARGQRDIVMDAGLKPYDILALVPIIEGAGGRITGWDGSAVTLEHFSAVLAVGDAALHPAALNALA